MTIFRGIEEGRVDEDNNLDKTSNQDLSDGEDDCVPDRENGSDGEDMEHSEQSDSDESLVHSEASSVEWEMEDAGSDDTTESESGMNSDSDSSKELDDGDNREEKGDQTLDTDGETKPKQRKKYKPVSV